MPIHDWTRVDAGLFHAFHHRWIDAVTDALNDGLLPPEFFALPEQRIQGPIPDVLTLRLDPGTGPRPEPSGGLTVADVPVRAPVVHRVESRAYAAKASRVTVRHRHGEVVAVIEIVSPGNKAARAEFRHFVERAAGLLRQGVHLLVIDLFPPGPRDPHGLHRAIWDEIEEVEYEPPPGQPLAVVAYDAAEPVAYIHPLAVGDRLPDVPVFLAGGRYVSLPLEETYQTSWRAFPAPLKRLLG